MSSSRGSLAASTVTSKVSCRHISSGDAWCLDSSEVSLEGMESGNQAWHHDAYLSLWYQGPDWLGRLEELLDCPRGAGACSGLAVPRSSPALDLPSQAQVEGFSVAGSVGSSLEGLRMLQYSMPELARAVCSIMAVHAVVSNA